MFIPDERMPAHEVWVLNLKELGDAIVASQAEGCRRRRARQRVRRQLWGALLVGAAIGVAGVVIWAVASVAH